MVSSIHRDVTAVTTTSVVIFIAMSLQLLTIFPTVMTSSNDTNVNVNVTTTTSVNTTSHTNMTEEEFMKARHEQAKLQAEEMKSKHGDVFASSAHLEQLASDELNVLIPSFQRYVAQEKERIGEIERLLAIVSEEREAESEFEMAASKSIINGNPLSALHILQRFTSSWEDVWSRAKNTTALRTLENETESTVKNRPTEADVKGAMTQIARLQETYDLSIDEIVAGSIAGRVATRPLSQQTVFQIGVASLDALLDQGDLIDDAIRWLNYSINYTSVPPLASLADIYHSLARCYALTGVYLTSMDYAMKAIELDQQNAKRYIRTILPPPEKTPFVPNDTSVKDNYYRLCRSPVFPQKPASLSAPVNISTPLLTNNESATIQLHCEYKTSKLVRYLRYKVEYLHQSPPVILIHDFITDNESQSLREMSTNQLQRAMVGSGGAGRVSLIRVGKIAWLYDTQANLVKQISVRISDVTGLNIVEFRASEPLQMSNYGLGGHYEPHFDHFAGYSNPDDDLKKISNMTFDDRVATFMLYLNKVELGGATVFPDLALATAPIQNAAIFWYNYKKSGFPDRRMLHAGCPVILGEKWVANKWIHVYGQREIASCGLTADM